MKYIIMTRNYINWNCYINWLLLNIDKKPKAKKIFFFNSKYILLTIFLQVWYTEKKIS